MTLTWWFPATEPTAEADAVEIGQPTAPSISSLEISRALSTALRVAVADVLGEPLERVELDPVYDSIHSGVGAQQFHASCDHLLTPTLTLLVDDSESYAVGGYATVPWNSTAHAFLPDPYSFLFHLTGSPDGYHNFVHPPADQTASIYCGSTSGPIRSRQASACCWHSESLLSPIAICAVL